MPDFNPVIHYFGKPCKYGHASHGETNLRYRKDGKCVKCCLDRSAEWKENNVDTVRKSGRTYMKKRRETDPEFTWRNDLWYNYGITVEQYRQMFEDQNGVCMICGNSTDYRLCVDHNHETGEVRGLLCRPCNSGLANYQENVVYLQNAINYLRRFKNGSRFSSKCSGCE